MKYKYKGGDASDLKNYIASYYNSYHRGNQHVLLSEENIDEYITRSAGEIDKKIEAYLKEESGKILLQLEMVFMESYTYRRTYRGSFIPTSKKLANTKCTINSDNKNLIDPETNKLSEKCL